MKKLLLAITLAIFAAINSQAQEWNKEIKIVSSDRSANDWFGESVAQDNGVVVIGAPYDKDDTNGENPISSAGSAYIFQKQGGTLVEIQKIVASNRNQNDYFGKEVAISNNTIFVSAIQHNFDQNDTDEMEAAGAVFIYTKSGSEWVQTQKLVPSDRQHHDKFGKSLYANGDYLAVGSLTYLDENGQNPIHAAGAVYIFHKEANGEWVETQKIVSFDRSGSDQFGYSVAISLPYLLVGAIGQDYDEFGANKLSNAGACYYYQLNESQFTLQNKLTPPDRAQQENFGYSVAIAANSETSTIGIYNFTSPGKGTAYLASKSANVWGIDTQFNGENTGDEFGLAVAIDGNNLLVGAPRHDHDASGLSYKAWAGAGYLYQKHPLNGWELQEKIIASDRNSSNFLGKSIAINDDNIILGSHTNQTDENGQNSLSIAGAAYLFSPCVETESHITRYAKSSFTSPSGNHTWTTSGAYTDNVLNEDGCLHTIYIDLTITEHIPISLMGITSNGHIDDAYHTGVMFDFDLDTEDYDIEKTFDPSQYGKDHWNMMVPGPNDDFYGVTKRTLFHYVPKSGLYEDLENLMGWGPFSTPILGSDGNLYGMLRYYLNGKGSIYRYHTAQQHQGDRLEILHVFSGNGQGELPYSRLEEGADGVFYGMTQGSTLEDATIFSININTPSPEFSVLYNFRDGNMQSVLSSVHFGSNGKIYGTTFKGGKNNGGALFEFNLANLEMVVLHDFNSTTGTNPMGSVIKTDDNRLFGMASFGGSSNKGVVFAFDIANAEYQVIHDFTTNDAKQPSGMLLQASNGMLYGTSRQGGENGSDFGTIFEINPLTGGYQLIYSFEKERGYQPKFGKLVERISPLPQTASTPTNLRTTEITETGAQLRWSHASPIGQYRVRLIHIASNAINYFNVTGNELILTGLQFGSSYRWNVKSFISEDQLFPGNFQNNATFETRGSNCIEPSDLTVLTSQPTNIEFTWQGDVDYWNVRYDTKPPTGWTHFANVPTNYFQHLNADLPFGDYRLQIRGFCGELATEWGNFDFSIISNAKNSVDSKLLSANIEIFPNPTEGNIQISGILDPTNYRLVDMQGIVSQEGFTSGSITFSDRLSGGVYFLELITQDQSSKETIKLIIR